MDNFLLLFIEKKPEPERWRMYERNFINIFSYFSVWEIAETDDVGCVNKQKIHALISFLFLNPRAVLIVDPMPKNN
jgi:hypothetical protein